MDKEQLCALQAPFSPELIRQREGSFGKRLDYLEAHSVIERLNEALGGRWSFHIVSHQIREPLSEILVVGKIVVDEIEKMQIGSARIRRHCDSNEIICLGDDLKAAASDALKKCATLLGVGLCLYHSEKPSADKESAPASAGEKQLSRKQHALIVNLSAEAGISLEALDRYCQGHYDCRLEALGKPEASRLIEALFAGQIKAA